MTEEAISRVLDTTGAHTQNTLPDSLEHLKVFPIMHIDVLACSRDDTLTKAAELMWNGDCGSIPVVDPMRRLIGIITDRDVCMAAYTQSVGLSESHVFTAMQHHVWTCSADDTLAHALELMRKHRVRRLPVVDDDGQLLGIVTLGDISCLVQAHSSSVHADQASIVSTIAAISEPRTPKESAAFMH